MFVIKATLKDETRRLVFDGKGFPPYGEVQQKVSPASTQQSTHSCLESSHILFTAADDVNSPFLHAFPPILDLRDHINRSALV
jgi:hypothetical protein